MEPLPNEYLKLGEEISQLYHKVNNLNTETNKLGDVLSLLLDLSDTVRQVYVDSERNFKTECSNKATEMVNARTMPACPVYCRKPLFGHCECRKMAAEDELKKERAEHLAKK